VRLNLIPTSCHGYLLMVGGRCHWSTKKASFENRPRLDKTKLDVGCRFQSLAFSFPFNKVVPAIRMSLMSNSNLTSHLSKDKTLGVRDLWGR
jgi:hypothetical protein